MRLDKYVTSCYIGSRKEVKEWLKEQKIKVNGIVMKDAGYRIDETKDQITFQDQRLHYQANYYFLLNKPKGYVSATQDNYQPTILSLFQDLPPMLVETLFPVGRLDIDTEGMILVTNDGDFAHKLTSPNFHIEKKYQVTYTGTLRPYYGESIILADGTTFLPPQIEPIDYQNVYMTLTEGKFHEVKRIISYLGGKVTALKRVQIGAFKLPKNLPIGHYIELSVEEIQQFFAK
ncbi:MAG: rRNA pseudouridine synthase [Prevotella sp.]|nr:rRNA pseudouridine synthase [Staphylococcus sp.]MCM1350606.1 rRNA pseudouridine synthase [Prevotella sp.]